MDNGQNGTAPADGGTGQAVGDGKSGPGGKVDNPAPARDAPVSNAPVEQKTEHKPAEKVDPTAEVESELAVLKRLAIKGLVAEAPEHARDALGKLIADRPLADAERIVTAFKQFTGAGAGPGIPKDAAGAPVPTAESGAPITIAGWAKGKNLYT